MSRQKRHKTVSSLQAHLKDSIVHGIKNEIREIALLTVREYILKNVYDSYTPAGDGYERTYELARSVSLGNIKIGHKYITFEIFMDTSKINPYEQKSWNAHANIDYTQDTSDYIPLWVEEGTEGSLWDRDGAHYMEDSTRELDRGELAFALYLSLSNQGWQVTRYR